MSLLYHLDELRRRVIICMVTVIGLSMACYFYSDLVMGFLTKPYHYQGKLVFIAPQEAFVTTLKVAVFGGIILALPVIFYEAWKFVAPGLKRKEKRGVLIYTPASVLLFLGGGAFCYFIVLPIGLNFLLGFSQSLFQPMISIDRYISFVTTLLLAFGVIFELPLLSVFLTKIGILTPEFLIEKRKMAIVVILVISALLTPPDVFTQLLMAGPLILLYEISIGLSKLAYQR